jgi:hypothetical protein
MTLNQDELSDFAQTPLDDDRRKSPAVAMLSATTMLLSTSLNSTAIAYSGGYGGAGGGRGGDHGGHGGNGYGQGGNQGNGRGNHGH